MQNIIAGWFDEALSMWGIGAKTSAGYGYFIPKVEVGKTLNNGQGEKEESCAEPYPDIISEKPAPLNEKKTGHTLIEGIKKDFNVEIWKKISSSPYICKIKGLDYNALPNGPAVPCLKEIKKEGKLLHVEYRITRFNCTVEVELQGVQNAAEAKYIWEKDIKPVLKG